MASSPQEAMVGIGAVGIGVLLVYAAYRNAPVLGPDGLLTTAITTGKLGPVKPRNSAPTTPSKPIYPTTPGPPSTKPGPNSLDPYGTPFYGGT